MHDAVARLTRDDVAGQAVAVGPILKLHAEDAIAEDEDPRCCSAPARYRR